MVEERVRDTKRTLDLTSDGLHHLKHVTQVSPECVNIVEGLGPIPSLSVMVSRPIGTKKQLAGKKNKLRF